MDQKTERNGRLSRITAILAALGNPHKGFRSVHIAGSNGKGSTLNALKEILIAEGLEVGSFTSPHLEKVNERIMMNDVMITDDQRLMREGLKTILDLEQDITVVQLAENGRDALNKIADAQPDVILMDIRMPIMDGVKCTGIIKQQYPGIKILILTTFDDDEFIIEALKNGAVGYILKDLSSEKLVGAIRDAYNGSSIMQPEIAAKVISHITGTIKEPIHHNAHKVRHDKSELTDRERDVLHLVGKGMSNTEIAKNLYISEGTVKNYISNLYSKLEVDDRSKLTLYAIKN